MQMASMTEAEIDAFLDTMLEVEHDLFSKSPVKTPEPLSPLDDMSWLNDLNLETSSSSAPLAPLKEYPEYPSAHLPSSESLPCDLLPCELNHLWEDLDAFNALFTEASPLKHQDSPKISMQNLHIIIT